MSDLYVDLSDHYIDLSENYVKLSDNHVDLSEYGAKKVLPAARRRSVIRYESCK